jgi:hypothetical protein
MSMLPVKKPHPLLPFILVLAVLGVTAVAMLIVMANAPSRSHATPTAPSYTAQNMEALKVAQPNDLLLCVIENGTNDPTVQRAVIVESSTVERVVGYSLDQYSIRRTILEYPYFDSCDLRLLRPSETRAATDMLASVILYGLNPKPPVN